jgi:GntR family transcriptional regulator
VRPRDLTDVRAECFYSTSDLGEWRDGIEFHLDTRSGIAPYLQIVRQVHQALLLGLLAEGDKLPTVKEVVAKVAINPNTVSKAYRELEHQGLAAAKPGVGTFIIRSLGGASLAEHGPLRDELRLWLGKARAAGLTEPGIEALIHSTFRETAEEET